MRRISWRMALAAGIVAMGRAAGAVELPTALAGNPAQIGNYRITRYSPNLIRIEHDPEQRFCDAPTTIVPGRPRPSGLWREGELDGRTLLLALPWELALDDVSRPPDGDSLEVHWTNLRSVSHWRPGDDDPENLGGTAGSLDGVGADNLRALGPGLLSRKGIWVIDDSASPTLDPETGFPVPRPEGVRDLYICRYGADYALGLRRAAWLLGSIPMPPKWAFGAWYSRYWPYTADDEKAIVTGFRQRGIPLDVLVIDVDWHLHGWEGYDWNLDLFPDPDGFLDWVADQGCRVTLNNHPGRLPPQDSRYGEAWKIVHPGTPVAEEDPPPLQFNLADSEHARAFFDVLHRPLQDQGIDFWWIDGQAAAMPGLNGQMWSNHAYCQWTEAARNARGLILSRYGGPGSHRYPVLFSGDTYSHWPVLDYEIEFTATAGNVLAAYWSHDIGGFMGDRIDPDLFLRWVQFGCFSPVFRLHSNHGTREPWAYGPEIEEICRKFIRLRQRMIPYFYALARETHDTGLPLCRPMYLAYPHLDPTAYEYPRQYFLGPHVLVAPIGTPSEPDGAASKVVWIPPGLWYDFWTDEPVEGPDERLVRVPRSRIPIFVRAGGVIPYQPDMDYVGQSQANPLTVDVYGAVNGTFTLYDDDGDSLGYLDGACEGIPVTTRLDTQNDVHEVVIGPAQGTFAGQLQERSWIVRLRARAEPSGVEIDGATLERRPGNWTYDRAEALLAISVPRRSVRDTVRITVRGQSDPRRFQRASALRTLADRAENALATVPPAQRDEEPIRERVALLRRTADRLLSTLVADPAEAQREHDESVLQFETWFRGESEALGLLHDITASIAPTWDSNTGEFTVGSRVQAHTAPTRGGWTASWRAPDGWSAEEGPGQSMGKTAVATCLFRPPEGGPPFGRNRAEVIWTGDGAGKPPEIRRAAMFDVTTPRIWRVAGPFANDENRGLHRELGPETGSAGPWPGLHGAVHWASWPEDRSPIRQRTEPLFIDLQQTVATNDWVVACAETWLHADQATHARFAIGSDDGAIVRLNGTEIFRHEERRAASPGQNVVDAELAAGWNRIIVTLGQTVGAWGFFLQITGRDGNPLEGVVNRFPESS